MLSGSFSFVLRRSNIVSFFTSLVRSMTDIISEMKEFSFSSSLSGIEGFANSSILVIPLVPKFSLVRHWITVSIGGKNTKILRNRLAAGSPFSPLVCRFLDRGWGESKNSLPYWYFAGYVNYQAAISRYVYGLCDGHVKSIA